MNWQEVCKQSPAVALSFTIVIMALGLEAYGLFHGFSPTVDDLVLGRILGTFDAAMLGVMNYWFGSTKGSQEKDATIASQLPPIPPTVASVDVKEAGK